MLHKGLSVDGVVVDADGKPVRSLEITAALVGTDDRYGPAAWTDQDGRFEIRGLKPGHYRLSIPPWFSLGLRLTGGDDVAAGSTGLALTAIEGSRLAGIVVDENGAPNEPQKSTPRRGPKKPRSPWLLPS
ncbi:MAG TPA: carboxypeptidase-like regulatory domain-containing protein [Planctomycetota bacterium]|nr:carboxypeptidase-like regulatory domain-containing protein [Planctomycetota bacterium]